MTSTQKYVLSKKLREIIFEKEPKGWKLRKKNGTSPFQTCILTFGGTYAAAAL